MSFNKNVINGLNRSRPIQLCIPSKDVLRIFRSKEDIHALPLFENRQAAIALVDAPDKLFSLLKRKFIKSLDNKSLKKDFPQVDHCLDSIGPLLIKYNNRLMYIMNMHYWSYNIPGDISGFLGPDPFNDNFIIFYLLYYSVHKLVIEYPDGIDNVTKIQGLELENGICLSMLDVSVLSPCSSLNPKTIVGLVPYEICDVCFGKGTIVDRAFNICPACQGTGHNLIQMEKARASINWKFKNE